MSFITKRERVFSDFSNPVSLPARNEGKIKAYASCTDTRAWSHFVSDKTEHLIDIIKKNNEACPGKYVPVNVIIEMITASKNAEIDRLKRKIARLEQMLEAFDELELSCEQKCEISAAHAMISEAYKSLEELPPLELDTSGFTEITESEDFMTGKSGGDDGTAETRKSVEWSPCLKIKDSKDSRCEYLTRKQVSVSTTDLPCQKYCDVSTSAHDTRVDDLKEALISKDAKLSALQNTIAVMENDVCEPYCLYAHIYTALEKIYATLSQNDKYRLFLNLMTAGKDIRCLDIKGKILFKLKILEKFSIALLSPCSERFKHDDNCECYYAEVSTHVETTYALTSAESKRPDINKRAQLFADIMNNDEIKEILEKSSDQGKLEEHPEALFVNDTYSIDSENLSRLKNLQINYDDLVTCYENVKHERDNLKNRCKRYEEMEADFENLKVQLREYNTLYNEREYYRKRSDDLDSLKEQVLVLADETSGLETRLKAEAEINSIKSNTIDELRSSNIELEQKLNEATIAFEKEKNTILCTLREAECKIMCQEQQIKSLAAQIDRLLEQDPDKGRENLPDAAYIMDEMDDLKSQIKNLNDALYSSEDEKQLLQCQFEAHLQIINDLRMDIENWKSECEKAKQRNEYLEKYSEGLQDDIRRLAEDADEKNEAVANLMSVIQNKSQEVNRLLENMEAIKDKNRELTQNLKHLNDKYGYSVQELEIEKNKVQDSLEMAKKESQELLEKVKNYDELVRINENISKDLTKQTDSCTELRTMLVEALAENKKLWFDLSSLENNNTLLLEEIQRLRDINNSVKGNVKELEHEKDKLEESYELKRKESENLVERLNELKKIQEEFNKLSLAHEKVIKDNIELEKELHIKTKDLDDAITSVQVARKESETLLEKLQRTENITQDLTTLTKDYQNLLNDKQALQNDLNKKDSELENLARTLIDLKTQNNGLLKKSKRCSDLEKELNELKKTYRDLAMEKNQIQKDLHNKTQELNELCNTLEEKIKQNRDLLDKVTSLEHDHSETADKFAKLQDTNETTQSMIKTLRRESSELLNKLKDHEMLLKEYEDLKRNNDELKKEKHRLLNNLEKMRSEKDDLLYQNGEISSQKETLQQALSEARQELIQSELQVPYKDLIKEINEMKKEQKNNNMKIKELLEKLNEADNTISNLSEDLLTRDERIAILENHINSLEDEMQLLHKSLEEVIDTGEELKDNSKRKLDQTLNKMEAHHSKAAHNMKMELAKLQNENIKLGEQVSITKLKSDESLREAHKYLAKIVNLQNEREIIVTDIKQLELSCIGDTNLSPTQCSTEEVLKSLDNIRKCIEARNSKSNSLEKTILKVQTSSQLLITKADEAKRLVEKEKQKILNEKEQAIAEKLKLEQLLLNQKLQLEEQTLRDKKVIKDLEGELLNQKLIIDKLNQQTQSYISSLEEKLNTLQNLYQNSIDNINELQDKIRNLSEENSQKDNMVKKIKTDLELKSKEVENFQKSFEEFKNKPKNNISIQVENSSSTNDINIPRNNISTQVENPSGTTNSQTQTNDDLETAEGKEFNEVSDKLKEDVIMFDMDNVLKMTNSSSPPKNNSIKTTGTEPLNEVQIFSANVEPNLDFVKSSYRSYKQQQLRRGNVEILTLSDIETVETPLTAAIAGNSKMSGSLICVELSNEETTSSSILPSHSRNYEDTRYQDSVQEICTDVEMSPNISKENDLFLIYQESDSSHTDEKSSKDRETTSRQPPIVVETVLVQSSRKSCYSPEYRSPKENTLSSTKDHDKLKINVKLPRVELLSPDSDIASKELYANSSLEAIPILVEDLDVHLKSSKVTRLDADVFWLMDKREDCNGNKKEGKRKKSEEIKNRLSSQDFGMKYILESIGPDMPTENLRKTKSDSQTKSSEDINYNSRKTSCNSKTCKHSKPKMLKEKSIEVNMDAPDYYENKIKLLTKQLQNTEKDYKRKLEAIKAQYDNNIKCIINDHNQGVNNMQSLHEETLHDIIHVHENEVENLRSMSLEALRRADILDKENKMLKMKLQDFSAGSGLDDESMRTTSPELKKRRSRCRGDTRMLSKTKVEAFNVKPKVKHHGPCTCSLDKNVSDTIRNIFEQVDVEQRKLAEQTYMKYIANKLISNNIEALDVHELTFLHLKVCRMWKSKLSKDEAMQKKIDSLESQLLTKERSRQKHMVELDRNLEEQRHRLTEARNAVCRCPTEHSLEASHQTSRVEYRRSSVVQQVTETTNNPILEMSNTPCTSVPQASSINNRGSQALELNERRSAGDLAGSGTLNSKRKPERRAGFTKLDVEERREKKICDEPPTRLRRAQDRNPRLSRK